MKNQERFFWTSHAKIKMRYYGLSEKRVLKILRKPDRREQGIVPKTLASMQISGTKKRPTEVWMMYQTINTKSEISKEALRDLMAQTRNPKPKKIRIISAWRYPGRTPENARPMIPDDIIKELNRLVSI